MNEQHRFDPFDFMRMVVPTGKPFPDDFQYVVNFEYAKTERDYWMRRALDWQLGEEFP